MNFGYSIWPIYLFYINVYIFTCIYIFLHVFISIFQHNSGLAPRLVGEVLTIFIAKTLIHVMRRYIVKEKVNVLFMYFFLPIGLDI